SKRKRGDTAEKSGDLPEKLNRVRSLSLFGGGIQRKPRVIRGAHKQRPHGERKTANHRRTGDASLPSSRLEI
ncbi:hypothetical protein, partial [Azoarcus taiwanensis]|uniref:hypothetical protein n=1 Tax=Azoarcus taiwanensis TaxID=666964 RepID=UPI001B7CE0B8